MDDREVGRVLRDHAEHINKLLRAEAKRTNTEMQAQSEELLEKLIASSFEKSTAYANVILAAGYAGIFAVWSFTKADLTSSENRWIAALILLSLTVFILWEIIKMIASAQISSGLAKLIEQHRGDPVRALAEFQRSNWKQEMLNAKVWPVVLILTLAPAIISVGILLAAFLRLSFRS